MADVDAIKKKLRLLLLKYAALARREAAEEGRRPAPGLKPPLPPAEVDRFEAQHRIRLPEGYREFLLRIGDGGLGPPYGLFPLRSRQYDPGFLEKPFPYTRPLDFRRRERELRARGGTAAEIYDTLITLRGTLCLSHCGCGVFVRLVVTGAERGNLWTEDLTNDAGIFPVESPGRSARVDFLSWYERWLDGALSGVEARLAATERGGGAPRPRPGRGGRG